jgi:hypothetical protein
MEVVGQASFLCLWRPFVEALLSRAVEKAVLHSREHDGKKYFDTILLLP